jgi:hypothetical protein
MLDGKKIQKKEKSQLCMHTPSSPPPSINKKVIITILLLIFIITITITTAVQKEQRPCGRVTRSFLPWLPWRFNAGVIGSIPEFE